MVSKRIKPEPKKPSRSPATSPESREHQMVALAVDEAERQMREGTASSQVVTHYLKLGSTREKLEQARLMREVDLLEKKIEGMDSAKKIEELYETALHAMRSYSGDEPAGDPLE